MGELCLGRYGRRGYPGLYFRPSLPSGPGPARRIAATVTRSGANELSASFLPASVGASYRPLRWQVLSVAPPANCPPAGAGCSYALPAHPELAKLHTPKLVGCVASGPSLVYGGSPKVHDIALTFDDGPWSDPPTTDFIRLLAREHVPASFFEIGDQISEFDPSGSVERAMLANGDIIGDHTWNHPDMAALGPAQQRSELELTVAAIRRATGFTPCLWRPPYGDISPELISLARSLGLLTVMWDIDPRDWALPGVGEIIGNVTTHARNGGIVEEHFGGGPRFETLDALPSEIADLRARGYTFVTVSQLLGVRMIYR
jgi:peptidoglycan/xylan/chitin deacetylase (PgdA/CDA1 family)